MREVPDGLAVGSKNGAVLPTGSAFIVVRSRGEHHARIAQAAATPVRLTTLESSWPDYG